MLKKDLQTLINRLEKQIKKEMPNEQISLTSMSIDKYRCSDRNKFLEYRLVDKKGNLSIECELEHIATFGKYETCKQPILDEFDHVIKIDGIKDSKFKEILNWTGYLAAHAAHGFDV